MTSITDIPPRLSHFRVSPLNEGIVACQSFQSLPRQGRKENVTKLAAPLELRCCGLRYGCMPLGRHMQ